MIDLNLPLQFYPESGDYIIRISDPDVVNLWNKYGMVNVVISKPKSPGTEQQNRLMHALMTTFYLTGMHSSPAQSIDEFKLWLKIQIGVCYEYEYQGRIVRVPKSWAKYSKQERMEFIDALISLVVQSGAVAESPKIQEILVGLEENRKAA